MKQREESNAAREKEVSGMINQLEQRFELLQTEALEYKHDLNELNIKYEYVTGDLTKRTEQYRALQHKYDDEMQQTSAFMEQATKKIYDLQASAKDSQYEHQRDMSERMQELEKVRERNRLYGVYVYCLYLTVSMMYLYLSV